MDSLPQLSGEIGAFLIVLNFIRAIMTGMVAESKVYNTALWFIIGLIGGVLGFLLAGFMASRKPISMYIVNQ